MINVLIVEDDPMVMQINKRYTELVNGFNVVGCVTREEEILEFINKTHIDLIILDVYLPEKNGLEILKNLRQNLCTVDVIMVTAANTVDKVKKAFAYGVIDYLVKPFEFERFQQALNKYLNKVKFLTKNNTLNQSEIDMLCKNVDTDAIMIPKGLQKQTLNKIVDLMKTKNNEYWTIKEISYKLKISNVTIKKYMDYLENSKCVISKQNYGNIGRPEYNYILTSNPE